MECIYLKKSGIFVKRKKSFLPIDRPFSFYLKFIPKLDKDFTVEDLMNALNTYESDVDFLFQSFTRGYILKPFFDEMNCATSVNDKSSKISKLVFSWIGNVDNLNELGKPKFEMSEYVQLSGKVDSEKQLYSLSFVNLSKIKSATFSLNKKIVYQYIDYGDLWDENRKTKKKTFFKGVREFTFYDLIGSFLYEISFFGDPKESDEQSKKLDAMLDEGDKSEKIPMEVVQLRWKKKWFERVNKKKKTKKNLLLLDKLKKEIDFLENKINNSMEK